MEFPLSSLRVRFLALPMLGTFLLLLVVTFLVFAVRETRLADAMTRLVANAERLAEDQNNIIQYVEHLFSTVPARGDLRKFRTMEGCEELLASMAMRDKRIANIAVAAPGGDVICNSTSTAQAINVGDRQHYLSALAAPGVVMSRAVIGRSSGTFGLPFARAIRSVTGEVQYVIVALVDLQWVNNELARTKVPQGSRIGLVASRGLVLARFPDPDNWIGKNVSDTAFFQSLVSHDGKGTFSESGFDNIHRVYGVAHFAETTDGPIFLWIGVDAESITGTIDRQTYWMSLFLLVTLGLLSAVNWVSTERLLLRPILKISEASRRLGEGDRTARTGLRHTDDEIGRLARSFDSMAIALISKSEILRLNRALKALSSANGVLIHANDETELLHGICNVIVKVAGYRLAWVGFVEHDADKTVRPVAHAGYKDGFIEQATISWADNEQGRGPAGTAVRSQRPCVVQNAQTDPMYEPWRDNAARIGYGSVVAFPLVSSSQVFGTLCIYSAEINGFDPEEIKLLAELADDLAFGVTTVRTRVSDLQSAKRLTQSIESTIAAVGAIVEMRDPYTAGHQDRVSKLSAAIASEMSLTESEIHGIRLAASVHDLGKIQVPAEILSKPSKLTDIEYTLIKEHAQAGYNILKNIDFPWPIAEMVYQHHERVDGSGYPRGLKDAEILIGAKIMAVADTVEAMSSHRPYRPGLGIDKAVEEITKNRGTHYDARVVDCCAKLFKEGRFKF